ncbi:Minor histocompatibility antigen H13 [Homalodisca vitripennis]|nr:Minor histocompatibility antigen H13 [Homalodisca vitripennis]
MWRSARAFVHSQTAFKSNEQVSSAVSAASLSDSIKYFAPFVLICMSLLAHDSIAMTSAWKNVAYFPRGTARLTPVVFPQDLLERGVAANNFAMLGLGDIVVPGIFIALLLRFDLR